ncbi:MAG: hypothetical protein ILO34_05470 [Kiritimatiellae bacterium]|nr:hypothetical protein [Kiritimatiellia bacterium]
MAVWIARIVLVVALLGAASALATPKGRLPLALRGLAKTLGRDVASAAPGEKVSPTRRILAFLSAVAAVIVAVA